VAATIGRYPHRRRIAPTQPVSEDLPLRGIGRRDDDAIFG